MEGPDYKLSAEPEEFKAYLKTIRNIEAVMGDDRKVPTGIEKEISKVVLKRIVSKNSIAEGQIIAEAGILR